jgi:NAD(P)-dependent dehydrogenase (short-subunit alcohol dehydrogenase family)
MKLKGKRAIVTGSSSGIGRDIALFLARAGARVVVNARGLGANGTAAIDAVVDEIRVAGGEAVGIAGAVDNPAFAEALVAQCVAHLGGIDILINNAAILIPEALGPVGDCSLDAWEQTLRVNLFGPFYTSRAALPHMIKQRWGRIINAGSYAGLGWMGGSGYSTAKSGLFGMSRAMAADYGPYGITVNVYNPEAMTTMNDDLIVPFDQVIQHWVNRGFRTQAEAEYIKGNGGPEGISPWIAYLCSDAADYINGEVFAVESRRIALVAPPDETRVLFRDFGKNGPWSLDELSSLAPLAFPVANRWPRRTGEALAQWEKS